MIEKFTDKLFILVVVKNNTVVEPQLGYGLACR